MERPRIEAGSLMGVPIESGSVRGVGKGEALLEKEGSNISVSGVSGVSGSDASSGSSFKALLDSCDKDCEVSARVSARAVDAQCLSFHSSNDSKT